MVTDDELTRRIAVMLVQEHDHEARDLLNNDHGMDELSREYFDAEERVYKCRTEADNLIEIIRLVVDEIRNEGGLETNHDQDI